MSAPKQTTSFWMANFEMPTFPPLKENLTADVCIVGAGVVGLTCAYLLSKKGKKVIILDTTDNYENQTARTTGHLVNILDDRYTELERLFGTESIKLIAQSHQAAVDFIKETSSQEKINCHFENVDVYLFVPPGEPDNILDHELAAVHRAGIDAKMVDQAPLEFNTGRCVHFSHQAQFTPLEYMSGLMKAIEKNGGAIYFQTHVSNIENKSGKVHVSTENGFHVIADQAIVATNTPINDRFIIHTKQAAYRTYVIAAKVPPGYVTKAIYYDTPDPYHYIRLAKDANGEEYIISGGEDHRVGEDPHPEERFECLEEWTRVRFPAMGKVKYKWSGQIYEPVDSLAFIGKNPFDENIFIATGDSGNGLTHGTIAGILITDLVFHKKNKWKELYEPSRMSVKAINSYLEENLNTLWQYRDWLTKGVEVSEIPPNSGAVVREGIKKVAVYCDANNKLHKLSAVCPHLGGIVRWNAVENSWDCPCHGSRFDAFGKVINGPAKKDLTKHEEKES